MTIRPLGDRVLVISVGPGVSPHIEPGAKVILTQHSGYEFLDDGHERAFVTEGSILAVFE